MARQIRWHGHLDDGSHEGAWSWKRSPQEDVYRREAQSGDCDWGPRKKVVRPSHRREMAQRAVSDKAIPIRLACEAFRVSESCYRYEAKNNAENELIANWLIRLTDNPLR